MSSVSFVPSVAKIVSVNQSLRLFSLRISLCAFVDRLFLPVISPVEQVILGVNGPIEGAPFGRHRGDLFGRRIPVVPFAVDRVVTTEDRHPIILRIGPGGGTVGQCLGEEE